MRYGGIISGTFHQAVRQCPGSEPCLFESGQRWEESLLDGKVGCNVPGMDPPILPRGQLMDLKALVPEA